MRTLLRLIVLSALAALSTASGALQSARFDFDEASPRFPQSLIFAGVTEGHVVFAISISAEGVVNDSIVLAYTHEAFVPVCKVAMKDWKITPATLDGQAVPVQMELRIDFKREGFVETSSINISNHFLLGRFTGMAERRLAYHLPRPSELDGSPVLMKTVDPEYAKEAEMKGIRGKVRVYFYINEEGEVRLPSVIAGEHPYLSEVAISALRKWHFSPAVRRGKPVMVAASQDFIFGR